MFTGREVLVRVALGLASDPEGMDGGAGGWGRTMDVARVRERHHELELEGEALGLGRPRGSLRGASLVSGQHRARVMWRGPWQVPSRCASAEEAPEKICAHTAAKFGFNNAARRRVLREGLRARPAPPTRHGQQEDVRGRLRQGASRPARGNTGIYATSSPLKRRPKHLIFQPLGRPFPSSTHRGDLVRPPSFEPR